MDKSVFVLGELNVDMILTGKDVTPEPNKEKLVDGFEIVLGSSSAITACRLAGLGLKVFFVSVVGNDYFGHFCIERLNRLGVDTTYVAVEETEKTGITVSLSGPTDRSLLTFMGTISKLTPQHIPEDLFRMTDHIHFGSYFLQERMRPHWVSLFKRAKESGITTSFDTGWDPGGHWYREQISELLPYTDLFMPSEEEVKHIFGLNDLQDLPGALPERRGKVAVKLGAKGSLICDVAGGFVVSPAFRVTPVDTTGAGDSFNAGLIYAFLEGKTDRDALDFANACGALSTQAIGGTGGDVSLERVRQFAAEHRQNTNHG